MHRRSAAAAGGAQRLRHALARLRRAVVYASRSDLVMSGARVNMQPSPPITHAGLRHYAPAPHAVGHLRNPCAATAPPGSETQLLLPHTQCRTVSKNSFFTFALFTVPSVQ